MKTNELRIGNIIEWSNFKQVVTSVSDDEWITCDPLEAQRPLYEFEPIPITEEWLVRLGFVSRMKGGICLGSKFDINFHDSTGARVKTIYIKHVHQLQNLYFALTGEELTTTQQP